MEMHPTTARALWKALMDNASSLITDAGALLALGSFGRARSLTVLAQEELGKALWIYESFQPSWSASSEEMQEVSKLTSDGRRHVAKFAEAFVFGEELAGFWGDHGPVELPEDDSQETWDAFFAKKASEAKAAGKRANDEKMAGFYVDLDQDGETVHSPGDIPSGTITKDLQTAAQVVEMLLIKDHGRMKLEAATPYDSTYEQQHRLLPISHPENWEAAPEEFRTGDSLEDPGARRSSNNSAR